MAITFSYADVRPLKWKVSPWKKWLKNLAEEEGFQLIELDYIFCSDAYLLEINIQHLNHHTYTDIITFDLSDEASPEDIESEIYISLDRVAENAEKFRVPFETELARVLAHGLLHLCGYKDKTAQESAQMREKENYYISKSPT